MRVKTAVLCIALAGCAASGVKVTGEQLQGLHPGQTTVADVVRAFGPPTAQATGPTGETVLVYSYVETSVRAATLIPIVGAFAGGADSRATGATLRFDRAGRLIDYSSSQSQHGTGVGLSAGAINTAPVPQPRQ